MKLLNCYNRFFERYFPSPLTIALILTGLSFLFAFFLTKGEANSAPYFIELTHHWFAGLFKSSLLEFTIHMMLILVLGHIIALSKPVRLLIDKVLVYCTTTKSSAVIVSLFTMILSFFNWGLGLIFGALLAREIALKFKRENRPFNYPLVGVAAYVGMLVFHGGLSGSAPIAVAGEGHTYVQEIGVIGFADTIFSSMNIFNSVVILIVLPLLFYYLAKMGKEKIPQVLEKETVEETLQAKSPNDIFEQNNWVGRLFGAILISYFIFISYQLVQSGVSVLSILNLKSTNLLLLGLAFFLQGSIRNVLNAIEIAIGDVSGILIQFPLYFGIMGLIQGSGLALLIADAFTTFSSDWSLPVFTFLSAAILNVFIPSGGGQWQVQAPIIIASASQSNVAIEKLIMAMCYGDQLTNMLQPFWAIPLLTITGLKAKEILPYCLLVFLVGGSIFLFSILIF